MLFCTDVDLILPSRKRTLSHVSKIPVLSDTEEMSESHVLGLLRQVFSINQDNQSVTETERSKTFKMLQKVC